MELEAYTFVLLHRGPRASEYSEEELTEIQTGHLAFLTEQDPAIQAGRMPAEVMTWLAPKGALE